MSRRRSVGLGILALLTVVLTACAGLPTTGPVNAGLPPAEGPGRLDVDFLPERPALGASPQQIVEGFVDAATSPAGNFEIARSYLAPALRDAWDPGVGVTIDQPRGRSVSEPENDAAAETDTVTVTFTPTADVDEAGSYRVAEAPSPASRKYVVAKQSDGEYRVVSAPDGIVLDSETFKVVFNQFTLMYFDPTWRFLVPDVRWFPARTNTATNIASKLIDGAPSAWLEGAVVSAFPQDVALKSKTVPVTSGVAHVELDNSAVTLDDLTLSRMQAQLQASLATAGVPRVDMLVGINVLAVMAAPTAPTKVDGRAFVQTATGVGFVSGNELEVIPGLSAQLARLQSQRIELAPSQEFAAVLGVDGQVSRVPREGDALVLDSRRGLIAPTVDPWGAIWSVPRDVPSAVIAYRSTGEATAIASAWPDASEIAGMQLSRDGTRVAAAVTIGGQSWMEIAAVRRDADGKPVALGEPVKVARLSGPGTGIAWVDDTSIAAAFIANEVPWIATTLVGGPGSVRDAPMGTVSLAGGNNLAGLRLQTSTGELFVQRASTWQQSAEDVLVLATQQGMPLQEIP